jgi:hypothetical protein
VISVGDPYRSKKKGTEYIVTAVYNSEADEDHAQDFPLVIAYRASSMKMTKKKPPEWALPIQKFLRRMEKDY